MTLQELSVEFDILYNNISSNQAPGLSEYEKSVFLTHAQEAIIIDLYKGVGGDSFENTEELTRYLNPLVKKEDFTPTAATDSLFNNSDIKCYTCDLTAIEGGYENLLYIVFQGAEVKVTDTDKKELKRDVLVVPTTLDRLHKNLRNPFKRPDRNKIFSLCADNKVELYSEYSVSKYYIKYLERPYPIILEDLPNGLTINNKTESEELTLPESTHRSILLRAIQLAQTVWKS